MTSRPAPPHVRPWIAILLAIFCLCPNTKVSSSYAQEEEAEAPPAEEVQPSQEELLPDIPGDVVLLKSGRKLVGIQVLRSTPTHYYFQVMEGMKPMKVLRRQVVSIEYDDIDPERERRTRELQAQEPQSSIISGEQVAPELNAKITIPIKGVPRKIKGRDIVEVLEEIAKKMNVPLEIGKSVRKLPPAERQWTFDIPEGTTLAGLLQGGLPESFPVLVVDFQFDKIVILTKEAAKKIAEAAPRNQP